MIPQFDLKRQYELIKNEIDTMKETANLVKKDVNDIDKV